MWDHPDALVLVAGGNTGSDGPGSIGSPATCKNGVAVGASLNSETSWENFGVPRGTDYYNQDSLAGFSSRGPTFDNRLKPDVCAPGESTFKREPRVNVQHSYRSSMQGGISLVRR